MFLQPHKPLMLISQSEYIGKDQQSFDLLLYTDGDKGVVRINHMPYEISPEAVNNLEDLAGVFYNVRLDVFGAVIKLLQGAQDPMALARAIAREYA